MRKSEIVKTLGEVNVGVTGNALETQPVDLADLKGHVVTKDEAKKNMGTHHKQSFSFFRSNTKGSEGGGGSDLGMGSMSLQDRERSSTIMHYAEEGGSSTCDLSDFDLLKVLGKGSFGKVMQVRKKDTKEILAMKVLHKDAVLERNQVRGLTQHVFGL